MTWSIRPQWAASPPGLYTAPASVVTPLLVTARAQSTVDTTRSGASWVGVGQKTGEIKYQDTFNSPFLYVIQGEFGWTRWSVVDEGTAGGASKWKSVDSILTQTSNIYGGGVDAFSPEKPGTYLLLPRGGYDSSSGTFALDPYEWKNYTVTVRLRSTDDDAIGIMSVIATPITTTGSRWTASGSTGGW